MDRKIVKKAVMNIAAVALVALFLAPLIWMILCSFKEDVEIFRYPPTFFPENPTVQAYVDQLESGLLPALKNSIIISGSSALIGFVLGVSAAYGLARFKSKAGKPMILGFLLTQMLPPALLLIPLYLLYNRMGLINTQAAPILSTATSSIPFIVIMMRPFFASLPKTVEEAARVDGCTMAGAFFRIMLPIARPGLATSIIFSFVFAWNDLVYSMTFISDSSLWPMTTMINDFQTKYGTQWNSILAYGVCLIIPTVIIFTFSQKYVVSGLTSGAVKE